MMASHCEVGIENAIEKIQEVKSNIDRVARHIQNLFNIKKFYDLMHFNLDQCLAITEEIIELIDMSVSSDLELLRGHRRGRLSMKTMKLPLQRGQANTLKIS